MSSKQRRRQRSLSPQRNQSSRSRSRSPQRYLPIEDHQSTPSIPLNSSCFRERILTNKNVISFNYPCCPRSAPPKIRTTPDFDRLKIQTLNSQGYTRYEGDWLGVIPKTYPIKWASQDEFVSKLKKIQALSLLQECVSSSLTYHHFSKNNKCIFGSNKCNLPGGDFTDYTEGICWRESFLHYVESHNVKPSKEFYNYVMDYKLPS